VIKITFPILSLNPTIPLKVLPRPYLATKDTSSRIRRPSAQSLKNLSSLKDVMRPYEESISYEVMRVVCLMEDILVHCVLRGRIFAGEMEKAYQLFREKRKI